MRIIGQIRERWPNVKIIIRGDSGFCRDEIMRWNGGIITGSHNVQIITKTMSENKLENYILFIPGGVGTRENIKNFISDKNDTGRKNKNQTILTTCRLNIV